MNIVLHIQKDTIKPDVKKAITVLKVEKRRR